MSDPAELEETEAVTSIDATTVRQARTGPLLEEGESVAGRYRVEALLGRGGFGEVYRVRDEQHQGKQLALKLHRLGALSREALEALKAEFALLASLSHPNLVEVHDFSYVEREFAFFTETLAPGVPLHRAGVDPREPAGALCIAQLCRALDYLHARGIVHGDVKPNNVLVDVATGHVTLLDFGVSRALGGTTGELVSGSPSYMAPELLTGGIADGRTDLYALGITLYQLLARSVPFRGSASQIVRAHVAAPPPMLPTTVPDDLRMLVTRLLAKDPNVRPRSAAEVLAELSRMHGLTLAVDTSETLASHVLSAPFVGRDAELAWLLDRALLPSMDRVILLEGDGGAGKSRLLREARQRVQLRGQQWIQVQAPRAEGGEGLLVALARAMLDEEEREKLADDDRLELARALPELRRPRERLAVPLDPARARQRRLAILGRVIAARFERMPGMLAIEDLHWAPEDEQRELAVVLAAARAGDAPCRVLLATRPGAMSADLEALEVERAAVTELSPDASRALVAATLGDASLLDGTEIGDRLASAPSPALWLRESLRLALEQGAIERRGGRFERTGEIEARELKDVLASRVRHLSNGARALALASAVLARESTGGELARVAGLSASRAAPALTELTASGILERRTDGRGRALHAMHDRYGDMVIGAARAAQLLATRRRAGRLLARQHARDFRALSRAAHELVLANDRDGAVRVLERAVAVAESSGRPEQAVLLLERELSLRARSDPSAWSRVVRLHDLAVRAGHAELASSTLAELTRTATGAREALAAEFRQARSLLRAGDTEAARARCEAALERAKGPGDEELACELAHLAAEVELAHGTAERALVLFEDAAAIGERAGRQDLLARCYLGIAVVHVRLGQPGPAAQAAERGSAAAKAAGDPVLRSETLRALGNAWFMAGERAAALRTYPRAIAIARESGDLESEAKALNNLGSVSHGAGHVRRAMAAYRRAIELKERVGAMASAHLTWASLSGLCTILSEHAEARAAQQRVIDAERGDGAVAIALAWSNRGDLEAMGGDLDAALRAYERGEAGYRALGMHQLRAHALAGGIRTSLLRGRAEDRERAREWILELAKISGPEAAPEDQRRHTTARAMVDEADGDIASALAHARAASRIVGSDTSYDDLFGSPIEARYMIALILARSGRSGERALRAAQQVLERRAAALDDQKDRAPFLEKHPLHRTMQAGLVDLPPGTTWRLS